MARLFGSANRLPMIRNSYDVEGLGAFLFGVLNNGLPVAYSGGVGCGDRNLRVVAVHCGKSHSLSGGVRVERPQRCLSNPASCDSSSVLLGCPCHTRWASASMRNAWGTPGMS